MNSGDVIDGRFRLQDRLGAGGMSVVWRAHDQILGRDVAVKVLSPALARDPARLADIRDEARAVARLRHPNVVEVYDYGEADGLPYLVMEVAEGRTLAQLLSGGALPWQTAVVVAAQVAAALAAAHERSVVHRDVKPTNVVVSGARVKLLDFGISAVSGDDDRTAGQLLGTPAYLAPERLEHGVARPATDVYALGLLLYRALAGRLPWAASTATQMLRAHRYQEPHGLPPVAGLPAEVTELCRRCLAKDPAQRPNAASAAQTLAAAVSLDPAILALPGVAADRVPDRPVRPAATVAIAAGRHRRLLVVSGVAALVAGSGAALTLIPDSPGPVAHAASPAGADSPASPAGSSPADSASPAGSSPAGSSPAGSSADGSASSAGSSPADSAAASKRPECTVGFVVATADGRFTTKVNVANTGDVPIPASALSFTLPADQRLAGGTPGVWRQNGRTVTSRISDLAPGSDHTATVRGTSRGTAIPPKDFQLDGTSCRVALAVAQSAPAPAPAAPAPPAKKPKKPKPK